MAYSKEKLKNWSSNDLLVSDRSV